MIGRMKANRGSYSAPVATWTNEKGDIWLEGDFVMASGDEVFLDEPTKLMIREVAFNQRDGKTAVLTLIDPKAFSGE